MLTVVTGATGWIGGHVVGELVSRGEPVRAVSRDPATPVPADAELHPGDLRRPSTLRPAFESATSLVLIAVPDTAPEVLALARECGVEHVVVSSAAVTAGYDTTYNLPVELAAQASGLGCTIVRPGEFATNAVLIWGPSIRKHRRVIEPYPEQEGNPIHERDVADVVVAALVDSAQRGLVHTIVGPDTLTKRQQVAAIEAAINAEIVVEESLRRGLGTSIADRAGSLRPTPISCSASRITTASQARSTNPTRPPLSPADASSPWPRSPGVPPARTPNGPKTTSPTSLQVRAEESPRTVRQTVSESP